MTGNDNAFPIIRRGCDVPGLTKRELFAAMAMQGFAARPEPPADDLKDVMTLACRWADALLATLAKPAALPTKEEP